MAPVVRVLKLVLIGMLVAVAHLLAAPAAPAQPNPAQLSEAELAQRIQALAEGGFNDKVEAVIALAATGTARAQPVLEALLDGRLESRQADGRLVIVESQGRQSVMRDALTGDSLGPAARGDTQRIRINNRVRATIRTALASLTLLSDDPGRRHRAAREMFGTTDLALEPILVAAIEAEQVTRVRDAMTRTLTGLRALSAELDGEIRLAAIAALAGFPDPAVRSALLRLIAQTEAGALRDSAADVVAQIDRRLAFYRVIGNLFQGVSLGSVLLLAAIGLAITFGVMGVINMAHGEMVMLGAYTTFVVQDIFRAHYPGALDYSLFVAIPAAFLVAGAFGVLLERSVIRFLYGRPLETLLATWGLSLILQQLVRTVFGATNREVSSPGWMSGTVEIAGGLALTLNRIWIIVFAVLVFAALVLVIRKTRFGLQMRAVTQNRQMANSVGIRSRWVDAMTFGLGSAIAGLGGVALSQIDNVSPNLGQSYIIDSFLVVVFGGVGNLWGTLVAALTLGIANKFLEPYAGAVLAKIAILVAVILFIQKRPRGLFALKGRAAEA